SGTRPRFRSLSPSWPPVVSGRPRSGVGPGPDGKLVAARLGEMESAAAREREYRLDDLPARGHHLGERAFEIVAIEDNERASPVDARGAFGPEETAVQALARESRVIG